MRNTLIFAIAALVLAGIVPKFAGHLGAAPEPPPVAAKPTPRAESAVVVPSRSRSVVIAPAANGHFLADGAVDGRRMSFVVDTGASVIALTKRDAERLGIHPFPRDYTAKVRTANGEITAAPVMLNTVEVGGITVRDVRALVLPERALSENLLGLSFLSRLRRFEYREGRLVLEQ